MPSHSLSGAINIMNMLHNFMTKALKIFISGKTLLIPNLIEKNNTPIS